MDLVAVRFQRRAEALDGGGVGGTRQLPEGKAVDVGFDNPAAIGGVDVAVEGFVYDQGSANETGLAIEADFCNVQFPEAAALNVGDPILFFGQIFESGVTDVATGQAPGVLAQFGVALDSAQSIGDFTFTDATFNTDAPNGNVNNDEYRAEFRGTAVGRFRVVFRFSLDGGLNWTACDVGGAGSNADLDFDVANAGVVVVSEVAP